MRGRGPSPRAPAGPDQAPPLRSPSGRAGPLSSHAWRGRTRPQTARGPARGPPHSRRGPARALLTLGPGGGGPKGVGGIRSGPRASPPRRGPLLVGGGVEVEAKEGGGGQAMVKTGGPSRPGIAVLACPLVLRGGRRGARGRARRALGSRDGGGGGGGCAGGGAEEESESASRRGSDRAEKEGGKEGEEEEGRAPGGGRLAAAAARCACARPSLPPPRPPRCALLYSAPALAPACSLLPRQAPRWLRFVTPARVPHPQRAKRRWGSRAGRRGSLWALSDGCAAGRRGSRGVSRKEPQLLRLSALSPCVSPGLRSLPMRSPGPLRAPLGDTQAVVLTFSSASLGCVSCRSSP